MSLPEKSGYFPGSFRRAAAALALPVLPNVAHAQGLAEIMFQTQSAVADQPASYEVEQDGARFVLDQTSGAPLMRFEGGREIFALRQQAGPRGDKLLKTDNGFTLLRITTSDSVIVYGQSYPTGAPAALVSASASFAPPPPLRGDLGARLRSVAEGLKKVIARDVTFIMPKLASTETGFFAEAADRAADGVVQARASLPPQNALTVRFEVANSPGAAFNGSELRVAVAPNLGYGGRPSSLWVVQAITRAQTIRPPAASVNYVASGNR